MPEYFQSAGFALVFLERGQVMRIVKCRKCRQRLFDIEDENYKKIVIKPMNRKPVYMDFTNFPVNAGASQTSIEGRENVEIEYNPADTSVRYVCPRCKLDLKIKLKTGVMEEIATK